MVTTDDRITALRAQAVKYIGPEWEDSAELSRLSVEAFQRNMGVGKHSPSEGTADAVPTKGL